METAINYITVLPSTKGQIQQFSSDAIESVLDGDYDPLKIEIQLKAMEEVIKTVRAGIREAVLTETDKYNGVMETDQVLVKVVESGRYDYSEDSVWNDLKSVEDNQAKQRKERETFLKALKNPVADPESGELINPPVKKFITQLRIMFK